MLKKSVLVAASVLGLGAFAALPASASYMKDCEKLITAWEKCMAATGECTAEEKKIEEECKCHRKKNDEWKLVTAAVGKDGVCDAPLPPDEPVKVPPPGVPADPDDGDRGDGDHGDDEDEERGE